MTNAKFISQNVIASVGWRDRSVSGAASGMAFSAPLKSSSKNLMSRLQVATTGRKISLQRSSSRGASRNDFMSPEHDFQGWQTPWFRLDLFGTFWGNAKKYRPINWF
jgi:hypothetical protein